MLLLASGSGPGGEGAPTCQWPWLVKVLLPASGPGPGGEGAPTCQWSWARW